MARKTWKEKLENGQQPEVCIVEKARMGIPLGAKMLIPTPVQVRDFVAKIPSGKTLTVPELRDQLAQKNGANITCPLCTGIFLRIVTEAAMDDLQAGAKPEAITPFWRVVGPKDAVAKKTAERGVPELIAERRELEGIT